MGMSVYQFNMNSIKIDQRLDFSLCFFELFYLFANNGILFENVILNK